MELLTLGFGPQVRSYSPVQVMFCTSYYLYSKCRTSCNVYIIFVQVITCTKLQLVLVYYHDNYYT